jgi:hypothetical protein
MVSVLQVYTALKDLANKEQKGFITPQVFNSFAALAQMNIYNEMFSELVDAKRLSRQNFDPGRDKSVRKQREEDLSFFHRREVGVAPNSLIPKPSDFSKIISLHVNGTDTTPLQSAESEFTDSLPALTVCELLYDPEKLDRIIGSNLSHPTSDFPVALVSAVDIEVFPEVSTYSLTYYAKPTSFDSEGAITADPPYYDFNVVDYTGESLELFDAAGSRNFMLPPHYLNEVVMEMAKLIGIRLRDQQVSVFSTQEEAAE